MPRRAPDGQGVTEHRITLGNWERNLIAETKEDIETAAKFAGLSVVAMPIGAVIGGGLLGYGAYAGMCAMAGAIPGNPFSLNSWREGYSNAKVHWKRLTDPDFWLDPLGYVDK